MSKPERLSSGTGNKWLMKISSRIMRKNRKLKRRKIRNIINSMMRQLMEIKTRRTRHQHLLLRMNQKKMSTLIVKILRGD